MFKENIVSNNYVVSKGKTLNVECRIVWQNLLAIKNVG